MPQRRHARGQQALASLVDAPLRQAWDSLVDPSSLTTTLPQFQAVTAAVVTQYGKASGAAALRHYKLSRIAAGVPGRPYLTIAPPPPAEKFDGLLGWATSPLWVPDAGPDLIDRAISDVIAGAERLVLNQGRDTLLDAVVTDPKASGWARVAEDGACAFCAMLATAGAHYKSEDSGAFEAHNNCGCSVEPIFENQEYKPEARVQAWSDLYAESTDGLHGDDALNAFRRAFDGADGDQQ